MHARMRFVCAARCMRACKPRARVVRVRAARRRTHKDPFSAVSASKAPAGIAVSWLTPRFLRARDEAATRQSSEAPCACRRRRGVDARERAGRNRACDSACRAASSLARCCSVASRARARARARVRADAIERANATRAGSTKEPMHTHSSCSSSSSTETRDACAHAIRVRRPMHARMQAACARRACARGASPYAQLFQRRQPLEGVRRNRRDLVVLEIPARARRGDASVVGGVVMTQRGEWRGRV